MLSPYSRPDLIRLPRLTPARRLLRRLLSLLARTLLRLLTKTKISGLEHFPRQGPALMVVNHLGDLDVICALAFLPGAVPIEALGKIDLYFEYPLPGRIMDAYGLIWLHRGQPDRKALRCALQALAEGRIVGLSPEGHESLSGGLEAGTAGAAFLALHSRAPLVPVTFTGTANETVYGALRRWQRPSVSMTVGPPFHLPAGLSPRKEGLEQATQLIMQALAAQLPPEYRGIYRQ